MTGRVERAQIDGAGESTPRRATARRSRPTPATRQALRRTARRYSLCADDADDALQRGLEILLRKAPTEDPRELVRWTQTVVKHEALAVRRERERILAGPAAASPEPDSEDWVALIPADGRRPGRAGRAPRGGRPQPRGAAGAEAAGAARPDPARRGLLLPRDRRDHRLQRDEDQPLPRRGPGALPPLPRPQRGRRRCAELAPLLSAFCDGEAERGRRRHPARAPARLPALPRHPARLPGRARRRRGPGADAAARARPGRPRPRRLRRARRPASAAAAGRQRLGPDPGRGRGRRPRRRDGGAGQGAGGLRRHRRRRRGLRRHRRRPHPARPGRQQRSAQGAADRPGLHRTGGERRRRGRIRTGARAESGAGEPSRPATNPPPRSKPSPPPEPAASSGAVEYTPPPPPVESAPAPAPRSSGSAAGDPAGEFGP